MSNETDYAARRRRLREEHELEPVGDAEEVTIIDVPGGFVTNDPAMPFCIVVDDESGQPVPGSESWPFDGRTPEEQLAHQRRLEGIEGDK